MAKYSIDNITEEKLPSQTLRKYYSSCKKIIASKDGSYPGFDFTDLDYIFEVACNNRGLFTAINTVENPTPETYINRWILSYCNAMNNLPSKKEATPKSSCNDPVIQTMVKSACGITDSEVAKQVDSHNLFMSAENVLGNLLEEYIAQKIRPYKWVWCAGTTLRAIDFCNEDGTTLLQIKNKNNSENSSSSNIREGTTIKKWYRLSTSKRGGKISPAFKWSNLNDIINDNLPEGLDLLELTEDDFQKYISTVVKANPNIITKE